MTIAFAMAAAAPVPQVDELAAEFLMLVEDEVGDVGAPNVLMAPPNPGNGRQRNRRAPQTARSRACRHLTTIEATGRQ
jgi:hypothetical protein